MPVKPTLVSLKYTFGYSKVAHLYPLGIFHFKILCGIVDTKANICSENIYKLFRR